jgi:four helix bundle protein
MKSGKAKRRNAGNTEQCPHENGVGRKDEKVRSAGVLLARSFPKTVDGIEVGRQLLRSGTSIGANYREANRAESRSDFIHKVGVAEKEAAETAYWLEICAEASVGNAGEVKLLLKEANELLAILSTIGRKAKASRPIKAAASTTIAVIAAIFPLTAF